MSVVVRFFAQSRELVGQTEAQFEIGEQGLTLSELQTKLLKQFPVLESIWQSTLLSLNLDYINKDDQIALKAGDEMAIIPPIGGG